MNVLIPIFILFSFFNASAQIEEESTFEMILNGRIQYSRDSLHTYWIEEYNGKTLLYNKKLIQEDIRTYFRYSDTTFVVREYFKNPDSVFNETFNDFDIILLKSEGLVKVSDSSSTTKYVSFDPLTFEEIISSPKILIHYGKWKYYHKNGKLKAEGNWGNKGKDGEWFYYSNKGHLNKIIEYTQNEIIKDSLVNYTLLQNEKIISNKLIGIWSENKIYEKNFPKEENRVRNKLWGII